MMGSPPERRPLGGSTRLLTSALLASVSLLGILAVAGPVQAFNLKNVRGVSPAAGAIAAQQAAAAQAAAAARQAQAALAQGAAALAAARKAQQDARALALQSSTKIPDGLTPGGLVRDPGVASDVTLWTGADAPRQKTENGRTVVDIDQKQQKAILNWQTFNVGQSTTVNFNQKAGDWTVLNRVKDPSVIAGEINAKGGVYIISRNGITFEGRSKVNVHALIASTLDVGVLGAPRDARDLFFINSGIGSPRSFSLAVSPNAAGAWSAAESNSSGEINVKAGASIATDIVDLDSPGFVYLFGKNVYNSGSLSAPAGEVAMVAARTVSLVPGGYWRLPTKVLPEGVTYRGTDFQITHFATNYTSGTGDSGGVPLTTAYAPGTGLVVHDGLIETPRGFAVMNGDRITIGATGVIAAETSISRNSMVLLRAATSVALNGTISSLPFAGVDPLTPDGLPQGASPGSTVQTFAPAYIEMSAQGNVSVGPTGLISAPSASVALRVTDFTINPDQRFLANNKFFSLGGTTDTRTVRSSVAGPLRVLLAPGATIDVAGLQDVVLPASYNFISFLARGLEFADMPLQRNGVLFGKTLWIDIRASGTRKDGTSWVGTPLANASGAVNAVPRSIYQLMTAGGTVELKTDTAGGAISTGSEVVLQNGSIINTAGGHVRFRPGLVPVTRLVGIDGHIYSMENADPNMIYVGIAGQFTVQHPRWNVTETWLNGTMKYEPGYVEGHDAGGVAVTTINPVLTGALLFGSPAGERQIVAGLAPDGPGEFAPTQATRNQLPSQGYLALTTPSTVVVGATGSSLPADFDAEYNKSTYAADGRLIGQGKALPQANPTNAAVDVSSANFRSTSAYQTFLSSELLSAYGLSGLSITANDLVLTKGSSLSLAAGGRFSVTTGGAIDIAGMASAAGGEINLLADRYGICEFRCFWIRVQTIRHPNPGRRLDAVQYLRWRRARRERPLGERRRPVRDGRVGTRLHQWRPHLDRNEIQQRRQ